MDGTTPTGHLLVLNGGSSAGKTTLGRKLQDTLDGSWLLIGIDALIWLLPVGMIGDPDGMVFDGGTIRRGDGFLRLYAGFRRAVVGLVSDGIDVILDDVLLTGIDDQRRWEEDLGTLPACWVGVGCDPDTVARREALRGDRPPGLARAQAATVHRQVHYDLVLDTGVTGVAESVAAVADLVDHRWSVRSVPSTDDPPDLPPTSAWSPDGSRRSAPWEQG
jgi:chloramphenicol 3-O phosphotransferase